MSEGRARTRLDASEYVDEQAVGRGHRSWEMKSNRAAQTKGERIVELEGKAAQRMNQ